MRFRRKIYCLESMARAAKPKPIKERLSLAGGRSSFILKPVVLQ